MKEALTNLKRFQRLLHSNMINTIDFKEFHSKEAQTLIKPSIISMINFRMNKVKWKLQENLDMNL